MDDPIVALSLWHGQNGDARKTANLKETTVSFGEEKLSCTNDENINSTCSEKVENSKSLEKRSSGDSKADESAASGSNKCFPCLPGIELDPLRINQKKVNIDAPSTDKAVCINNGDDHDEVDSYPFSTQDCELLGTSPLPELKSFWLLRLFESNLFTIDKAIQYLYTEKDHSVQEYLGKKLFMFDPDQVSFYLLQLATMFIYIEELYPILYKYFLRRCQHDVIFSLKLAWILNSNIMDKWLPEAQLQRASRMLYSIQNEQIRPPQSVTMSEEVVSRHSVCQPSLTHHDKSHHRSFSASGIINPPKTGSLPYLTTLDVCKDHSKYNGTKSTLGDLRSGRAFDTGCTCDLSTAYILPGSDLSVCSCLAPRLAAQDMFVRNLGTISNKLLKYSTKSLRTSHLYAELSQINLNLPARICLPLHSSSPHHIVRIPPSEAVVLNSKSKVPYIVYVEVMECDHTYLSFLPSKQLESFVKGFGLTPDDAKHYIHSEGPSPSNTRASSMPSLRCGGCTNNDNTSLNSFDGTLFNDIVVEERDEEEKSNGEERSNSCSSKEDSCSPIDDREQDGDIERVTFSVGDIRRRLTKESVGPKRMFSRDPTDPSAAALKEPWDNKVIRIQKSSPYGHLPNWKLIAAIVKWGDDLRQEMMCWQLLVQFQNIWREESVDLWIRPYVVVVLSSEGGLIEPVCNAVSLHQIKKQCKGTLLDYFKHEYGDRNSETFLTAQRNFVESCAAYCLVCYFIQVKDRHNGNILLDSIGHIIHIDFGFILANSPGNNIRFESSPFKLTEEFVEVMGGVDSDMYCYFKFLMLKGFLAARKHMDRFINIVKITQTGSQLPCFGHGPTTVQELRDRFHLSLTEEQLESVVNRMVENSMNSLTTKLYDGFQYLANGIL